MANINLPRINKRVKSILEKYSLLLKYSVLGPQALTRSEVKYLIEEGLIDPHHVKFTLGDLYLQAHLDAAKRMSRKSVRDYTIKHLRTSTGALIDKWVDKSAADIGGIIGNNLLVHTQQMRDQVQEKLTEGAIQNKSAQAIARAIRDKTKDMGKDWERVVNTELARAINLGSLDAIIDNNIEKQHNEIYVYKSGVVDSKLCEHCKKFWHMPDGTPRVYKLSELTANGSNYGKKAADWKATIEPSHPNCRHILLELSPGFGFKGGSLVYVSKDHDEYKSQRGK